MVVGARTWHIRVTEGKKYIKVIQGTSVWGFIVKEDGGKFRKGDILKAAGWNAPAMNQARGNIIDGGYTIQWTGPLYLWPNKNKKSLMLSGVKMPQR